MKVAADKKKWTDLNLKDAVGNKLVVYDGANDLAKAEPIAATLYQKDSESTGAVSYTHLDVYKRQAGRIPCPSSHIFPCC